MVRGDWRYLLAIFTSLLLLAVMAAATAAQPAGLLAFVGADPAGWLLFTALFVFTMTVAIPVGGGHINLMPMAALGGLLVLGPLPAAWMAVAGSLMNIGLRRALPRRLDPLSERASPASLLSAGLANAAILAASLLLAGAVYTAAGGALPFNSLAVAQLAPYVVMVITFMALNYALIGGYLTLQGGRPAVRAYRQALPQAASFELALQVGTPLLPLIYTGAGRGAFVLASLALAVASLVVRGQMLTGRRLSQRLADLDTLSAMSSALAASLDLDTILTALRQHLPRVMPAHSLYVALYDPEQDSISFPLAVEEGNVVHWRSRRPAEGLTEHVLRTGQPLLMAGDVSRLANDLGITASGRPSVAWLGVPISAGGETLGVLALQSFDPQADTYTTAHRDLLGTIGSQLALALKNALLYSQTDKALAQRVQQLVSILDTTREGMLLLAPDTEVLAANRAMAGFLGIPEAELAGKVLLDEPALLAGLGLTPQALRQQLAELEGEREQLKDTYQTRLPPARKVERSLAAVRDPSGEIGGWLLVLRDVTEEAALLQLRDDLTHMLLHDLRSPLGSMLTGLALIEQMAQPGERLDDDVRQVVLLAQRSGQHLLRLINQLLEIARLESGSMPLNHQPALPAALLAEAARRQLAAANAAGVSLEVNVADDLPRVNVDTELIARVLDNLADNAIKHSPSRACVRLWTRQGPGGDSVVFGVSDAGPGIPPESVPRLFQKFQPVAPGRGQRPGIGLGLAFCRLVVEAHQGRLWYEMSGTSGSTFAFSLPASRDDEPLRGLPASRELVAPSRHLTEQ
jgi:two-component system, NtrC family, sensor histidine kinase KinB